MYQYLRDFLLFLGYPVSDNFDISYNMFVVSIVPILSLLVKFLDKLNNR